MTLNQCPACNAIDSVRRSKSRSWERLLKRFGLQSFRCKVCSKRFHRRREISQNSMAQTRIARAAPPARNTSDVMPAIPSHSSLKVDTAALTSKPRNAHASNQRKRLSKEKRPSRLPSWKSFAVPYWFKSFAALLLLHFLVGTLEFEPLGKAAMWVNLLSLVTLVGALFVFIDLYRERRTSAQAVGVTVALVLRWAGSLFTTEFVYGYFLGPGDYGLRADLALYRDQSPWIWMTYAVLPVSGAIGCSAYLFYRSQRQVRFLN